MTQESENAEAQSQPPWTRLLGCVVGLVVLAFFVLFVLASLTANPKADGSVLVNDEANILSPATKDAIAQIKFPEDVPVVVRTVSAIPKEKIGTFASEQMSGEPQWQTLRPRGWLRRHIKRDPPWGPGVYVLVSLEPRLLQIRFGEELRLSAYQQLVAVGPWYRAQQHFEPTEIDQHVLNTVQQLAQRTNKLSHPPWPLSWAQYLSSLVISEVDDLLAPSNNLFSKLVLRNYIALAHTVGATRSGWRFISFNVAAFVLLWLLGKKLFIDWFLLPRIRATWLRAILGILTNLGLLGILVTGFVSLSVLSKGRAEDELALEALGLSFLSTTSLDATLFSTRGGLLLAIPGALISFVGEFKQFLEATEHNETRITFGWLAWGCMLFLLPKAIAIAALAMLLWKTGSEIAQSFSEDSPGRVIP